MLSTRSLQAVFHPMGYPVEVNSNSREVLDHAAQLWHRYPAASNTAPLRLTVIAGEAPSVWSRRPSPPKTSGHLFSIVHGSHDYAVADLSAGFAVAYLSRESISDSSYFRYYFLEPLVYVLQGARHFVYVHASCISRRGRAIVLCGDSGAGKTCLAYACAKRQWDFVSGDAVHIVREKDDRTVAGRPYEIRFRQSARQLFPELNRFRPAIRANGKLDLEIDTSHLYIPIALRSCASHVVFIERSNVTRMVKCPAGYAASKLAETICYGDHQTRREQRQALDRFVALPLWRLSYASPDHAEQALAELLDTGVSC